MEDVYLSILNKLSACFENTKLDRVIFALILKNSPNPKNILHNCHLWLLWKIPGLTIYFFYFLPPKKVLVYALDLRSRPTNGQTKLLFLGCVYTIWLLLVLTKTLVIVPPWEAAFCSGHNEVGRCLRIPGRNQHWRGDLGDRLHNRGGPNISDRGDHIHGDDTDRKYI